MILPMKAFEEILIIRSFDDKDPIKNILKNALDILKEHPDLTPLIRALEGHGKENAEIIEALKRRDKLGSQEAMRKHLEDTKNRSLSRF